MNIESQVEDSNYFVSQKPTNMNSTKGFNQSPPGVKKHLNKIEDFQSMPNELII